MTPSRLVVVTGVSGAGKSTVVHALEDLGFFCVDNLPPPVIGHTVSSIEAGGVQQIALGIDVRVGGFIDSAAAAIEATQKQPNRRLSVVFLDAADAVLVRRFSSTRRPHPLSTNPELSDQKTVKALIDGIQRERELLTALRARATLVIDTTRLSVHELRARVLEHFGPGSGGVPRMRTRFVSFGFKFGPPVDADLVLDVRFLKNPYFEPQLRELSGTDEAVRQFVLSDPDARGFLERAQSLLDFCLPRYEREGKSYLTLGVGCTGGRHRSVVIAEQLAQRLQGSLAQSIGSQIGVVHRDVERSTGAWDAGGSSLRV